jgi:hypothetical protein
VPISGEPQRRKIPVDRRGDRLYFAQQSENPEASTWPSIKKWLADVRDAMQSALSR